MPSPKRCIALRSAYLYIHVVVSTNMGPQHRRQHIIILIIRTSQEVFRILGSPLYSMKPLCYPIYPCILPINSTYNCVYACTNRLASGCMGFQAWRDMATAKALGKLNVRRLEFRNNSNVGGLYGDNGKQDGNYYNGII